MGVGEEGELWGAARVAFPSRWDGKQPGMVQNASRLMLVEIEAFWGKDCVNTEQALQDIDDSQVTVELMLM